MTTEVQNPYQSPAAVAERCLPIYPRPLRSALLRACGLGLLGSLALVVPVLAVVFLTEFVRLDDVVDLLRFSVFIGWTFASSEIVRIGSANNKDSDGLRIASSSVLLFCSFLGMCWILPHLLPEPTVSRGNDWGILLFWAYTTATLASHVALLLIGRNLLWQISRYAAAAQDPALESQPGTPDVD